MRVWPGDSGDCQDERESQFPPGCREVVTQPPGSHELLARCRHIITAVSIFAIMCCTFPTTWDSGLRFRGKSESGKLDLECHCERCGFPRDRGQSQSAWPENSAEQG